MNQLEKYNRIFMDIFGVSSTEIEMLEYQKLPVWDSVGHMRLMDDIEESFGIMLDTEDIVAFSSYKKGMEILGKYGIRFDA